MIDNTLLYSVYQYITYITFVYIIHVRVYIIHACIIYYNNNICMYIYICIMHVYAKNAYVNVYSIYKTPRKDVHIEFSCIVVITCIRANIG